MRVSSPVHPPTGGGSTDLLRFALLRARRCQPWSRPDAAGDGGCMVRPARESSKTSTVPGTATFQKFLDAAPDAMVIVDRNGRIAYANAQVRQLLGYDAG